MSQIPANPKSRLTDKEREYVCKYIALGCSYEIIAGYVYLEYGKELQEHQLRYIKYKPKWKKHTEVCRKRFKENIEDGIPLANKEILVQRLSELFSLSTVPDHKNRVDYKSCVMIASLIADVMGMKKWNTKIETEEIPYTDRLREHSTEQLMNEMNTLQTKVKELQNFSLDGISKDILN